MRKVIFGGANSLDNYIARADGSVDWLLWGDEAAELMRDMGSRVDTIVMGRKTWDIATGNAKEVAKKGRTGEVKEKKAKKSPYGDIATYVFSRTLTPGERDGVTFIADDPGKFLTKLKKQKGKDICAMGGGELGNVLLESGVIDEIGFNIHPVLLGSGIPLFHSMKHQIDLELLECRPFKNGCVYVLYKVR